MAICLRLQCHISTCGDTDCPLQEVPRCAMAAIPTALCVRQAAHAKRQRGMADAAATVELHLPSWWPQSDQSSTIIVAPLTARQQNVES
jgi:hypothetical protein